MKHNDYHKETNQFFEELLLLGSTLGQKYYNNGQTFLALIVEKARQISLVGSDIFVMPLEAQYANDSDFVEFQSSEFCRKLVNELMCSGHSISKDESAKIGYSWYTYKLFLNSFFYNDAEKAIVFHNTGLADQVTRVLESTRSVYAMELTYHHEWKIRNNFNVFPQDTSSRLSLASAIQTFSALWQNFQETFSSQRNTMGTANTLRK